ncbi:MAG: hypothetical protein U0235_35340 [Polyangiaceae bacterium]
MSKAPSPLLGYNNNVRHKNRVFHIQTEDSGVKHPHIITHLFMDGGRILKSVKKSYAEHIGETNMAETVRQLMKDQHKAMFIALRDGQFDPLIDAALGNAPAPAAEAKERKKSQRPPPVEPKEAKPKTIPAPPDEAAPSTEREQLMARALSDLPPPPANLFARGQASDTRYRSQPASEEHVGSRPPSKRPPSKRPSQAPSDGRYGAARPASIFGGSKPPKAASIFGEDLISDKSLDEVILSYLAEDLETETKK